METISSSSYPDASTTTPEIQSVQETSCVIVGGGPAGAVLALLLARQGIPCILLEAHKDFDRDFRGDTLHPSVMEIMEEIGLAERLLQLRHAKVSQLTFRTSEGAFTLFDFRRLKSKYPYLTMLPQVDFLEMIMAEAAQYPHFQLVMGANVQELIEEDGIVQGVRYREQSGWHEIRAHLTVGADGRFSRIRQLAGKEPVKTSPPIDVLWFRLPCQEGDPEKSIGSTIGGRFLILLKRFDHWQVGYFIPKGSYQALRQAGLQAMKESITEVMPELGEGANSWRQRLEYLENWSQVAFLAIESSRVKRWYQPGLLLIGDAAHVMSPVAGVGINYAIQDAVVAANVLAEPLRSGQVRLKDLAAIQCRREIPTRIIQGFQVLIQRRIVVPALDSKQAFKPPFFLRIPFLRDLPARLIGKGVWQVHINSL
ncbi:MAG: FAD-dependent oxidoreductase [Kastovskya adunca ATA6-11-RM4]|jgi:2-polyprenyl-6-methoxyphenol hydroxylase-like FAD-dependent oxidoreductase|nr:FAD-dependent oxidoreductase [Kastovskya adunca ATA6-11-RM4]